MDLGELGEFGDVEKTEIQEGNGTRRKMKENPPVRSCGWSRPFFWVVAVCRNTSLEIKTNAKKPNTGISDLQNIFGPLVR